MKNVNFTLLTGIPIEGDYNAAILFVVILTAICAVGFALHVKQEKLISKWIVVILSIAHRVIVNVCGKIVDKIEN